MPPQRLDLCRRRGSIYSMRLLPASQMVPCHAVVGKIDFGRL